MASQLCTLTHCRSFCTTLALHGKRNFRKFNLYEKRGSGQFWRLHKYKLGPELERLYSRGEKPIGVKNELGHLQIIPEMIPDIIVPSLEGFDLKPYVSYRVSDVTQSEFRPEDLFYAVYSKKISEDFREGKLNEDGSPKEPSEEEKLTAEDAKKKALQTGSDIYG